MNTSEVNRASKWAKLSLLFAVAVILVNVIETKFPPFKSQFQNSGAFRMQCVLSWIVGAAGAVYFGVRALKNREAGDRRSMVLSIAGLALGGIVLLLFLGGLIIGLTTAR